LLSISAAAFAKVGEKREPTEESSSNREFEVFKRTMRFVGIPTSTGFAPRVFRTFRISSCEKNIVFPAGFYPTEDSSDEKDGSLADCNSGASERRIDLFLCRRRRSDAHVLTGTLRREVSRSARKL
jgi:hypothetical protein